MSKDQEQTRPSALRRGAFWVLITLAVFGALGFWASTRFDGRPSPSHQAVSIEASKPTSTATPAAPRVPLGTTSQSERNEPDPVSRWPAPSFLGKPVGAVGFAPFIQAAGDRGSDEQMLEVLVVLAECARVEREIELIYRDRQPNGLASELLIHYQAISRACQTVGPAERALRLPMLKKLAASSAEASFQYFHALREAEAAPFEQHEALLAIHQWALSGHGSSAFFLAHSPLAAALGPVEQRALLLALRALAKGDAETLMRWDHPGLGSAAQRALEPATLEAQVQERSRFIFAGMMKARAAP